MRQSEILSPVKQRTQIHPPTIDLDQDPDKPSVNVIDLSQAPELDLLRKERRLSNFWKL